MSNQKEIAFQEAVTEAYGNKKLDTKFVKNLRNNFFYMKESIEEALGRSFELVDAVFYLEEKHEKSWKISTDEIARGRIFEITIQLIIDNENSVKVSVLCGDCCDAVTAEIVELAKQVDVADDLERQRIAGHRFGYDIYS